MQSIVVHSKEELAAAVESRADRIVVRGELAEKLNTALKIRTLSKWTIGLLAVSLASAPMTGGLSILAAAPIAEFTGIEIALIIAVASLGIALVLMICRDYKKVKFKAKKGDAEAEIELGGVFMRWFHLFKTEVVET